MTARVSYASYAPPIRRTPAQERAEQFRDWIQGQRALHGPNSDGFLLASIESVLGEIARGGSTGNLGDGECALYLILK